MARQYNISHGLRDLNMGSDRDSPRQRQEYRPFQRFNNRERHEQNNPPLRMGTLLIDRTTYTPLRSIRIVGLLRMAANGRDLQSPVILRYFKEPPASAYPMDLMEGFDSFVFPPDCYNDLVRLEKYMMQAKTNEGSGSSALTFCTQRSCLSSLFKMGLSKERFTVFATKVHNRIFMMRKGHKFSADSKYPSMKIRVNTFADSPDMAADPERIANECEQTFAIYHAKFGKYELLYSGEVDGIKADESVKDVTDMEEINKCQFVRVRCGGDHFWKMSNMWAQGYLSNSDHVYVATKDKANIVHQPLVRKTQAEIRQTYKLSPRRCCSYLAGTFDFIAEVMANVNCPYTVYEFDFKFDGVDYSIEYKVHEDKNELSFLSEEFIKFLEK